MTNPVTVTLRLSAKDGPVFIQHLAEVLAVTRQAKGCRHSNTYVSPDDNREVMLVQGWDSLAQQQAYIGWRDSTGDLKQFIDFLAKPPVVEVFELFDA
ncbi:putative quinol monooxygenase [Bosea sp. (in: a-proteobacteria)]|uniref:putative quinol monooxygenase n=1 Tax=Bosea sp. (in: a-proteobacteria) TaxID=1871050 RepID=UPI002B47A8D0|nr:antibiotic biosynthesis monooxygenase [Bosea sp. (in: a-proteobacteria)]WRH60131.1 MAG: antibiotic biosynthesis monooxygenase [Bosea sp. (in: a-proteobacteria)]